MSEETARDYEEIVTNLIPLAPILRGGAVERYIGEGTYGVVAKVLDRQGKIYVVKLFIRFDMRDRAKIRNMITTQGEQFIRGWKDYHQEIWNKEATFLKLLKGCKYVVDYEGHGVVEDLGNENLFPSLPLFYIVMEFIEGANFKEFFEHIRGTGVSFLQSLEIAIQLLRAIEHATIELQDQNIYIIHRDLRSTNIALRECFDEYTEEKILKIVVLDYGIAKQQDPNVKPIDGTPLPGHGSTLPPAIWNVSKGERTQPQGAWVDNFSVGMILFDLLLSKYYLVSDKLNTLRMFLKKEDLEKEYKNFIAEQLQSLEHVLQRQSSKLPIAELRQILAKALSYSPDDCYQTAHDMIDALLGIRTEAFYRQVSLLIQEKQYADYERRKQRLWAAMEWDSTDDEIAWNLFGIKLFALSDVKAAQTCFSRALRIAEESNRPRPWIYRNRAKLWRTLAKVALSVKEAKFYLERARKDWHRAEQIELGVPPASMSGQATSISKR